MTATNDELCLLSIEDAAQLIASKKVSPVELTEAVLARIERLNPKLNAYITVTAEQAIAEAKAAESEIAAGKLRGPLHGIPIAHKDLFDTKGVRTTAGMKIFADRVPDEDAAVVERLRAAGAVSLGKLGMHEAAYGLTSDNMHYGTIRNPWDADQRHVSPEALVHQDVLDGRRVEHGFVRSLLHRHDAPAPVEAVCRDEELRLAVVETGGVAGEDRREDRTDLGNRCAITVSCW